MVPSGRVELPVTDDALLGGRVRYRQPARGYRVGLEAPMMAAFAVREGVRTPRSIVDLGAGPGAIGLCVATRLSDAKVRLVERDPLHAALARENVAANGMQARVDVVESDVTKVDEALGRGSAELVVTNPPWFARASGPGSPDARREASRTLEAGSLRAFLSAGRQLLGRGASLAIAFPAAQLVELFATLDALGLAPKRLRLVHPRLAEPANVAFVDARAARPGGLVVEPPWIVRGDGDDYTPEVRALLWGQAW